MANRLFNKTKTKKMLKNIFFALLILLFFGQENYAQKVQFQSDSSKYEMKYGHYRIELFDYENYHPHVIIFDEMTITPKHYFFQSDSGKYMCKYYLDLQNLQSLEEVLKYYQRIRSGIPNSKLVFVVDEKEILNLK